MDLPCCAACLHAITEPDRPVLFQGRFFHPLHLPAEAPSPIAVGSS